MSALKAPDLLAALPKVELHVHLEGAVKLSTVAELARSNDVHLPVGFSLEPPRNYRDFGPFVDLFTLAARSLRRAEDYERAVMELAQEFASQRVPYAEVTFSPSTARVFGTPEEVFLDGLERGRRRARSELGVEIAWIFNIVRQWTDRSRNVPMAEYALDLAIAAREYGVIGLGLGGREAGAPPELFRDHFERARTNGLHSVPHAGEMADASSVWGALDDLGAERIGHGIRAVDDARLMRELVARRVTLEICPTSNLRLGLVEDVAAHPLHRLYQAGVPITISSDDPALFGTTLTDELVLASAALRLDHAGLVELVVAGVRASFLERARKEELEASIRAVARALQ